MTQWFGEITAAHALLDKATGLFLETGAVFSQKNRFSGFLGKSRSEKRLRQLILHFKPFGAVN